jgi:hypothetical protein
MLKSALFSFLPFFTFAQLSPKVDSLYIALNSKDAIESRNIGYGGQESDNFRMFSELDSIATDNEVLYMSQKGNNVVKGYMSEVLVSRKSKYIAELFSDYIKNDKEVLIQTGCTGFTSTIAGELYSYVIYQKKKIDEITYNKEHYTPVELKDYDLDSETKWTKPEVDSLLMVLNKIVLDHNNALPMTLRRIFALNKFEFVNYEKIKFFAYKYQEKEILATLASFQNKKDLPFLHKHIDIALLAISKFPDKSFEKIISEKFNDETRNIDYYEALAAFCTDDFNNLKRKLYKELDDTDDIMDGEYMRRFELALQNHNCDFNFKFCKEIELQLQR